MKVGILTLPLTNNYGGHLQAWALQKALEHEGYEAVLLDLKRADEKQYHQTLHLKIFLGYLLRLLPGKKGYHYIDYRKYQEQYFSNFRNTQFVKTVEIYDEKQLIRELERGLFDALIVGSDQVWRKWEMIPLAIYFLSWLNVDLKRVGYAISYGKSNWELPEVERIRYAGLAQKFVALSMREQEGVNLTKEYLGLDAELVLDPTMLLEPNDYTKLFRGLRGGKEHGLFYYILDKTEEKKRIISSCSELLNLSAFEVMPKQRWFDPMAKCVPEDYIYPPIEK